MQNEIKSDFTITIEGDSFDGISHSQSGIDALFPTEGKGSLSEIMERYGEDPTDLDVIMQSATYYRIALGRDDYAAIERGNDGFPFVLTPAGELLKAYDGQRFFLALADDDVLYATRDGWQDTDESVICFGAPIQN